MTRPPRKSATTNRGAAPGDAGIAQSNAPARARRRTLVDVAVTACILAARTAAAGQSMPTAGNAGGGSELAEVTVNAPRRTADPQNCAPAIPALTSPTLQ